MFPNWKRGSSPFSPLPPELKVAQVVGKPVHVAISQFQVHDIDVAVEEADSPAQAGGDSGRSDLARLGDDRVVVDLFVFSSRQLQHLGEDGVDDHVLGLPSRSSLWYVLELVEGSGALDKGTLSPVAVEVDQELCGGIAVVVEDADGIDDGVAQERACHICRGWYRL